MAVKDKKDIQLTFDFVRDEADTGFTTVTGVCSCGRPWEFRVSGIVMEMSVRCPGCSALLVVKGRGKS